MELERALLDYIIVNKDITVEVCILRCLNLYPVRKETMLQYAVKFYCCVWYKEILEDLQELEARYAESKRENLSEKVTLAWHYGVYIFKSSVAIGSNRKGFASLVEVLILGAP